MLNTTERINPRTNKLRGVSAGLLAVVALAGCSSSKTEATGTKPSTTVTTKAKSSPKPSNTTTTTTEAGPFNPYDFEKYNKQHNTAMYNAAQYYGNIILNQVKNPNSPWGPWEKACKPGSYLESNIIHKGSEYCSFQHPFDFGKNISLIVDVSVNNKGSDRKGIVSLVSMINDNCGAEIIYRGPGWGWEAEVLEPVSLTNTMEMVNTENTTTLPQAQALDKKANICFASFASSLGNNLK